jgi:acyl-CoA thioesterase FadM
MLALLRSWREPRSHWSIPAERWFRVWPHDLDAFGHMNNGRYLQIMDVARTAWMARTGVLRAMWQEGWSGVLGGGLTRYRHPLRPFQRYRVRTVLLSWDERWFYFEHAFVDAGGRCVAVGLSRAALRAAGDWVRTCKAVNRIDPRAEAPPPPDYLAAWIALDREAFRGWSSPDAANALSPTQQVRTREQADAAE